VKTNVCEEVVLKNKKVESPMMLMVLGFT